MKCECGCGKELTGKQARFKNDTCRYKFWRDARVKGAKIIAPKTRVHCGHPGRSRRLAKTLNVLMDLKRCTTLDIHERTGGMKVSGDVDDLRRAGYPVSMARYLGTTAEGRRVFEYRWAG